MAPLTTGGAHARLCLGPDGRGCLRFAGPRERDVLRRGGWSTLFRWSLQCFDRASGRVRFRWKDYRARHKGKAMTLDAGEFIRRFLLHVLPQGFRRIRHFGFLANAGRTAKLAQIRTAIEAPEPPSPTKPRDYRERYALLTGHRIDRCPRCGGCMVDLGLSLPRHRPASRPTPRCDSS